MYCQKELHLVHFISPVLRDKQTFLKLSYSNSLRSIVIVFV